MLLCGCSAENNIDKWFDIHFEKQGFSFHVAKQLALIPKIKESGKIKFIPSNLDSELFVTGYVLNLDIEPLDVSRIPEIYQKPWKIMVMGNEYEEKPIKNLSMTIKILLQLKDKDGFLITKLEEQSIKAISGQDGKNNNNNFQGKLSVGITKEMIQRVKSVEGQLVIEECGTCDFVMK